MLTLNFPFSNTKYSLGQYDLGFLEGARYSVRLLDWASIPVSYGSAAVLCALTRAYCAFGVIDGVNKSGEVEDGYVIIILQQSVSQNSKATNIRRPI